jgi:hypothetical protein
MRAARVNNLASLHTRSLELGELLPQEIGNRRLCTSGDLGSCVTLTSRLSRRSATAGSRAAVADSVATSGRTEGARRRGAATWLARSSAWVRPDCLAPSDFRGRKKITDNYQWSPSSSTVITEYM